MDVQFCNHFKNLPIELYIFILKYLDDVDIIMTILECIKLNDNQILYILQNIAGTYFNKTQIHSLMQQKHQYIDILVGYFKRINSSFENVVPNNALDLDTTTLNKIDVILKKIYYLSAAYISSKYSTNDGRVSCILLHHSIPASFSNKYLDYIMPYISKNEIESIGPYFYFGSNKFHIIYKLCIGYEWNVIKHVLEYYSITSQDIKEIFTCIIINMAMIPSKNTVDIIKKLFDYFDVSDVSYLSYSYNNHSLNCVNFIPNKILPYVIEKCKLTRCDIANFNNIICSFNDPEYPIIIKYMHEKYGLTYEEYSSSVWDKNVHHISVHTDKIIPIFNQKLLRHNGKIKPSHVKIICTRFHIMFNLIIKNEYKLIDYFISQFPKKTINLNQDTKATLAITIFDICRGDLISKMLNYFSITLSDINIDMLVQIYNLYKFNDMYLSIDGQYYMPCNKLFDKTTPKQNIMKLYLDVFNQYNTYITNNGIYSLIYTMNRKHIHNIMPYATSVQLIRIKSTLLSTLFINIPLDNLKILMKYIKFTKVEVKCALNKIRNATNSNNYFQTITYLAEKHNITFNTNISIFCTDL